MKSKIKNKLGRLRRQKTDASQSSGESVPRITNETVAEHRELVLGQARKYIYPLQHSKHRIVVVSIGLFVALVIVFFTYTTLALYRFQDSSTFLYRVTQILPFPVARTGNRFVAYENYLFELRHYTHYYQNQQELDFNTEAGQKQLAEFKRRAVDKVVNDAYVKQLAQDHDVTVSGQEVDNQIEIVRSQNRLGGSEQVLEDVLKEFWGWSLDDFKRSLHQQLLEQKLIAKLDTETNNQAQAALNELKNGADFAAVANKYSEDETTKDSGGNFGFSIEPSNRNLTAQTTEALFSLKEGEHSGIINIGYALEIVKVLSKDEGNLEGAHILFNFRDISEYVNDLKEKQPARIYVSLPPANPDSTAEEGVNLPR